MMIFGIFGIFFFENLEMNFYKLTKFQLWGVILVVEQDVISRFLWLSVNWLNWLPPTEFRNYVSFSIIHLIFQITCYVSTTMDMKSVILWLLRNCSIGTSINSIWSQVHKQVKAMAPKDVDVLAVPDLWSPRFRPLSTS